MQENIARGETIDTENQNDGLKQQDNHNNMKCIRYEMY